MWILQKQLFYVLNYFYVDKSCNFLFAPCPPSGNVAAAPIRSLKGKCIFGSVHGQQILQRQQMSAPRHVSAADIGPGLFSSSTVTFGSAPGSSFGAVAPPMPSKYNQDVWANLVLKCI